MVDHWNFRTGPRRWRLCRDRHRPPDPGAGGDRHHRSRDPGKRRGVRLLVGDHLRRPQFRHPEAARTPGRGRSDVLAGGSCNASPPARCSGSAPRFLNSFCSRRVPGGDQGAPRPALRRHCPPTSPSISGCLSTIDRYVYIDAPLLIDHSPRSSGGTAVTKQWRQCPFARFHRPHARRAEGPAGVRPDALGRAPAAQRRAARDGNLPRRGGR